MPLFELDEGVYTTEPGSPLGDFLAANRTSHNVTIIGKGPGVSEVQGKIRLDGWYPNISGIAIYPGPDTDWSMIEINNPGTFRLEDIWCHPAAGQTGLVVRATDWGVVDPGPKWPPRNAPIGGARISVSMLRDFYAYGEGRGLSVEDQRPADSDGQFVNHVRVDGGHINVQDTAMLFGKVPHVAVSNFHIDVNAAQKGLRFDEETFITWYAPGWVEPGWQVKQDHSQYINGPMRNLIIIGDWPRPVTA